MTQRSAAPARRFAALFYDLLLVLALWFVIAMIAVGVNGGEAVSAGSWGLPLTMMLAAWLFFVGSWHRGGQTPGMKAWRLKLIGSQDGQAPSFAKLSLYGCLALIGNLALGFNLIAAQCRQNRQSPAERLCDVRIVRDQPPGT